LGSGVRASRQARSLAACRPVLSRGRSVAWRAARRSCCRPGRRWCAVWRVRRVRHRREYRRELLVLHGDDRRCELAWGWHAAATTVMLSEDHLHAPLRVTYPAQAEQVAGARRGQREQRHSSRNQRSQHMPLPARPARRRRCGVSPSGVAASTRGSVTVVQMISAAPKRAKRAGWLSRRCRPMSTERFRTSRAGQRRRYVADTARALRPVTSRVELGRVDALRGGECELLLMHR
jgi:hypothetical protein